MGRIHFVGLNTSPTSPGLFKSLPASRNSGLPGVAPPPAGENGPNDVPRCTQAAATDRTDGLHGATQRTNANRMPSYSGCVALPVLSYRERVLLARLEAIAVQRQLQLLAVGLQPIGCPMLQLGCPMLHACCMLSVRRYYVAAESSLVAVA